MKIMTRRQQKTKIFIDIITPSYQSRGLLLKACSGGLMSLLQVFVMDLSFPRNCIECPTKDKDGSLELDGE